MSERTYCFYDLLEEMREKPALYLAAKSIVRLRAFVQGYDYAMEKHGIKDQCNPEFSLYNFSVWTVDKLNYSRTTMDWCEAILAETIKWSSQEDCWPSSSLKLKPVDDAAAHDRFYELLDQYRLQGTAGPKSE